MTASFADAYNGNPNISSRAPEVSRRNVLATTGAAIVMGFGGNPRMASAEEDVLTPVYFGVGVCAFLCLLYE
jgi:hypothetical protein